MIALQRERDTQIFGMWVFLATELMLFGGLFTAYAVYRTVYPAAFAEGSRHLDLVYGGVNTAVLITSSLTMSLAVEGRRHVVAWLVVTALLGLVFMAIKGAEYQKHFLEGMVPGLNWQYTGDYAAQVQLFFLAYFGLTGLHSLHLTIGIVVILIAALVRAGSLGVELISLYWHFVDVVWVFLLALLYLA
jgi:cytochrome c oxidase subunit 3